MKLIIRTYKLQLKHPFTISRGTRTEIPSIIVELQDGNYSGFGEATANPYYNMFVEQFEKELSGLDPDTELNIIFNYLRSKLKQNITL